MRNGLKSSRMWFIPKWLISSEGPKERREMH